jgi:hypothetical protein
VTGRDADDCARTLNNDVERSVPPRKATHEGIRESDYGVEVWAGDGFKSEDDGHECGAGCK